MWFGLICEASDIEHRPTKPNHPWTNAQLDRMNHTIEDATVTRYHSETHDQRRSHLSDILAANNLERRLKTLSVFHTLSIHLQNLNVRARAIYHTPDPPDAGTKQLESNRSEYT